MNQYNNNFPWDQDDNQEMNQDSEQFNESWEDFVKNSSDYDEFAKILQNQNNQKEMGSPNYSSPSYLTNENEIQSFSPIDDNHEFDPELFIPQDIPMENNNNNNNNFNNNNNIPESNIQEPTNKKRKQIDEQTSIEVPINKKNKQTFVSNPEDPTKIHLFVFLFKDTISKVEGVELDKVIPFDESKCSGIALEDQFISILQIHNNFLHVNKKKLAYPLENAKENGIPFLKLNELSKDLEKSFESTSPFLVKFNLNDSKKGHNGISDLFSLKVKIENKSKFWNKLSLNKTTFSTMSFHFIEDKQVFLGFLHSKQKRKRVPKKN